MWLWGNFIFREGFSFVCVCVRTTNMFSVLCAPVKLWIVIEDKIVIIIHPIPLIDYIK